MAFNEDIHETIEAYLDNRLTEAERRKFEQQMRDDHTLADEVALSREMQELLAESPENELRKNLEQLSKQEPSAPTRPPRNSKRTWLWLLPVLLLAGWLIFAPKSEQLETSPAENANTPLSEPEPAPPAEVPATPPPAAPEEQPASPPEPPPSTSQPIAAADFEPNPSLEFLIDNTQRTGTVTIDINRKQPDVALQGANDSVSFRFAATLKSDEDLAAQDFKLHLFSNDKASFEDFDPLFTNDLVLENPEAGTYTIDFSKTFSLQPGLYYYVLEDLATEKIYYVQKFVVNAR